MWKIAPKPEEEPVPAPAQAPAPGSFEYFRARYPEKPWPPPLEAERAPFTAVAGAGGTRDEASAGPGLADPALGVHEYLAKRFEIMQPGGEGERLPHQVTPEEFEKVCRLYQDIGAGTSNLELDTSRLPDVEVEHFRGKVMEDLASMLQTPSGRELIEKLATAQSDDGKALTTTISATPLPRLGSAMLDNELPANQATDPAAEGHRHDGTGTDMTVGHWARQRAEPGVPDMRSDVHLFRRLVGALHGVSGDAPADSSEEAQVGLGSFANGPRSHLTENAYRRARSKLAATPFKRDGDDMRPREFLGVR
jgi:hypothetical protein